MSRDHRRFNNQPLAGFQIALMGDFGDTFKHAALGLLIRQWRVCNL